MRQRAVEYAAHGWPVAPLAVPRYGRCPCEPGSCVTPHLAGPEVTDPEVADQVWADGRWCIALVTSRFDVIDIPARFGALLHQQLLMSCPTAMAPHGRRWHFVMETGSITQEVISTAGGTLHHSTDGWIPTSPTWTEDTGRIGWVVAPQMARWQPWQRRDIIDLVFGALAEPPSILDKLSINVRFS